jgi:FkbM family methyltransferase
MLANVKTLIRRVLRLFDIGITSRRRLLALLEQNPLRDTLELFAQLSDDHILELVKSLPDSQSQLRQDIFVLSELDLKRNGYFVEFGATNGIDMSNTYLLERKYQWQGILAEPARRWHSALRMNRRCHVEMNCVWSESDLTLTFNETNYGEFSTVNELGGRDLHWKSRKRGTKYQVNTISLLDLLEKYDAPKTVDYLSLDTEGSEFEILSSFDFDRYQFRVITCEHNYSPQREEIFALLSKHGYARKYADLSQFDDWYVLAIDKSSS